MANENTSAIISKVWGMCNPLRDDGVSHGDYLEQLTYLLFLKMAPMNIQDHLIIVTQEFRKVINGRI